MGEGRRKGAALILEKFYFVESCMSSVFSSKNKKYKLILEKLSANLEGQKTFLMLILLMELLISSDIYWNQVLAEKSRYRLSLLLCMK